MATNVGGYDLLWVDNPPDDLKCLICLAVAKDPQQHPGDDTNDCGKIFCQECITEYRKSKSTCPNCRQDLSLFKDAKSTRAIKALKVRCDNEPNGCEWTGELGSLKTHVQPCKYALIPCTNKCENDNKVAMFLRAQLDNHLINYCPRRQYECPHCKQIGECQEMTTTHLDICPCKVHCPNVNCDVTSYYEEDIQIHRSTCQYEPVPCKYADVGCEERPLRKDLANHEEKDQLHLRETTKKVLELTKRVAHFDKVYEESIKVKSAKLSPCTYKLSNYQEHKNNNTVFYSPAFYTSFSGYKMCLSVFSNGHGIGESSHISLFVHLMKGDNDDTLTWPFTGTVTIELLNQLKDKHHYKTTTTLPVNDVASRRVMRDERTHGTGWGRLRFISHTALDYNAKPKTQYLMNDSLVFRESVDIPNHKPWLECNM